MDYAACMHQIGAGQLVLITKPEKIFFHPPYGMDALSYI
jgi:hypothetical protein